MIPDFCRNSYSDILLDFERIDCENSLALFVQRAWSSIDPSPYKHNWHIDVIASYAEGIVTGDVRRLLTNQPPRTMKSILLSVAFPAWVWAQRTIGPLSGPQVKFMYASHSHSLSFDHSRLTRGLILSPWYQKLWGDRFKLADDRNTIGFFENDKGGYRIATSVGANITGRGADIIGVDDPHDTTKVTSEAERLTVINWWTQSLPTRFNDPKTGAYIVVMQRQHMADLSGYILSNENKRGTWSHVCIPMRYDPARAMDEDPRVYEGQLLWPDRFGEEEVRQLEESLGPYGAAGQLQQIPQPAGGGIIKAEWWKRWEVPQYPKFSYVFGSLDPAYGEKQENDYSALTLWGLWEDASRQPRLMLIYAWRGRVPIHELVEKTASICNGLVDPVTKRNTLDKASRILVENKASGISVGQELYRLYGEGGWSIEMIDPKGQDKVARAHSVVHLFNAGLIYAPYIEDASGQGPTWANMVIDECTEFPRGQHDDLTDTVVHALRHVRDLGVLQRPAEVRAAIEEERRYKRPVKRLYEI